MPGLKIPDFSKAISLREFPNHCRCSKEIDVITETSRLTTLVASQYPPMPVSQIMTSAFCCRKYQVASTVVSSKKVGSNLWEISKSPNESFKRVKPSAVASLEIGLPFTQIRSLKSTKCGEVKSPVFFPSAFKIESKNAQTDPLPFVPAICRNLSFFSGLPRRTRRNCVVSNPNLMPKRRLEYSHFKALSKVMPVSSKDN